MSPSESNTLSSNMITPPRQNPDIVDAIATSSSPLSGHSGSFSQIDSAYTHGQDDVSYESTCSSADQSMTTTTRAYKVHQIPANRPTSLLEGPLSMRVVSLPEATPRFHLKKILHKTARVVSMPLPVNRNVSFQEMNVSGNMDNSFITEDEERSRVSVRSHITDVSHPPSTPSSPDSVVIIANNSNQLSTDFLRLKMDEGLPSDSDDEDWVTWAQSPPRPIPALHGPLSLPYARCPSGAEGTIIEEPETLSRVIWGLENDHSSTRLSTKATKTQSVPQGVPSAGSLVAHRPPMLRTQAPSLSASQGHGIQAAKSMATRRSIPTRQNASSTRITALEPLYQPPNFIVEHAEPIDLCRLVSDPLAPPYRDAPQEYPNWQTSSQYELPTPELVHDLSPELQAMLFAQERLRSSRVSPPSLASNIDFTALPNASPSSISLLDALKSTRSPIVLEDLTSQSSPHPFSGTSALDLVYQYQQHQLQHSFLPTPPNSASPVWSSTFSPYQGGLLSPELLAAAGLSHLQLNHQTSNIVPPRLESSQHFLRSNPSVFRHSGSDGRKAYTNTLGPAAHIGSAAFQKLPPRLVAEHARRCADTPADAFQPPNGLAHQYLSPVRDLTNSPTVPKAPPNTPHGTASLYGLRRDHYAQPSSLKTPASPTSPRDPQNPGLAQPVRSIPLSKLVQRRLSTVPEEDMENGPSLSAPHRSSSASNSASGLHLFLSPGRQNVNLPAGALNDHCGTRYGIDNIGNTHKARNITPDVKLPTAPVKGHRQVDHSGASFVKEASRRQGSDNTNNDGSRRGDVGRGRGQKRSGRGRKGRGATSTHGAERVDGGMVVKS